MDLCVSLSFGYFVYDLSVVLYYYHKLPQLPTIIHHSFVIVGIFHLWVIYRFEISFTFQIYQFGTVLVTIALVEDISTVFLYTNFFMEKSGVDYSSKLYRLNQMLLYLTFPVFRFLYNWYVLGLIWSMRHHIEVILNSLCSLFRYIGAI
jgi:hypothetical protein